MVVMSVELAQVALYDVPRWSIEPQGGTSVAVYLDRTDVLKARLFET